MCIRDSVGMADEDRCHFAVILSDLCGEIIHGIGLVKQCFALVFLIAEDAMDCADTPLGLTCRHWDAHPRQGRSTLIERLARQKIIIDISDYNCLFLHDLRSAIRPFFVTKETEYASETFLSRMLFRLPQRIFSLIDRLSSCARELMTVSITSLLGSRVCKFSFSNITSTPALLDCARFAAYPPYSGQSERWIW